MAGVIVPRSVSGVWSGENLAADGEPAHSPTVTSSGFDSRASTVANRCNMAFISLCSVRLNSRKIINWVSAITAPRSSREAARKMASALE